MILLGGQIIENMHVRWSTHGGGFAIATQPDGSEISVPLDDSATYSQEQLVALLNAEGAHLFFPDPDCRHLRERDATKHCPDCGARIYLFSDPPARTIEYVEH